MRLEFVRFKSTINKHLITQEKFKECMGKIANQAMILSAAITSLSLKPQPLIQFNLQLPSFTSEALHETGCFAVHLLKPNATSIQLARIFSKGAVKNEGELTFSATRPFQDLVENVHYDTYSLQGTDLVVPILKNSERVLICEKKDVFKVGDHEIWVGKIEDIIANEQNTTGGLLYCNRHFHILGDKITNSLERKK